MRGYVLRIILAATVTNAWSRPNSAAVIISRFTADTIAHRHSGGVMQVHGITDTIVVCDAPHVHVVQGVQGMEGLVCISTVFPSPAPCDSRRQ